MHFRVSQLPPRWVITEFPYEYHVHPLIQLGNYAETEPQPEPAALAAGNFTLCSEIIYWHKYSRYVAAAKNCNKVSMAMPAWLIIIIKACRVTSIVSYRRCRIAHVQILWYFSFQSAIQPLTRTYDGATDMAGREWVAWVAAGSDGSEWGRRLLDEIRHTHAITVDYRSELEPRLENKYYFRTHSVLIFIILNFIIWIEVLLRLELISPLQFCPPEPSYKLRLTRITNCKL